MIPRQNDIVQAGTPQKIRDHVFWTDLDGITVVADMNGGKYFTFDKSASFIWSLLAHAASPEHIALSLADRYRIDTNKAQADVASLLIRLDSAGLIEPITGKLDLCTSRNISNSASSSVEFLRETKVQTQVGLPRKFLLLIEAYVLLILIDLSLKVVGFHRVWVRFESQRPSHYALPNLQSVTALSKMALSAFKWYRPGVACMHRAFTTYWFLKRRHIPAELCLGVKTCPFSSHAWVEYQDWVLDDSPLVKSQFRIIAKVT